ncbi:MAG: GMC family oxidoreductase [Planctomycetes bacterium]|nr:GMC family oxidoreductase [Planctomycetota bacterium]
MIRNLNTTNPSSIGDYDICIVGTGPAGMTLARELAIPNVRICVLESGEAKPTKHGDALRRVESDGIQIKEYSRERVFGGASTTWAGLSSPLDPIDFEQRPWMRMSGWPVSRDEILNYYSRASENYRFPSLAHFTNDGFGALRPAGALRPEWSEIDEKIFLACEKPQNFAKEHRNIFDSANVDLILDATAIRIESERPADRARSVVVKSSGGTQGRIQANIYILAAGGIENARLLLISKDACPEGLGNGHDQVGRYFMNHPKNYRGILTLKNAVAELPYYFGCIDGGFAGYGGLRFRESAQRSRQLLNSYVRFEPMFPWTGSRGVESLVTIAKHSKFILASFRARSRGKVINLRDYSETGDDSDLQNERKGAGDWLKLGWNVAVDSPRVARYVYFRMAERAKPKIMNVRLRNFMEMEPDPDNRITLTNAVDAFGIPVPRARHRCSELDKKSIVELHKTLRDEFPRAGVGSFVTDIETADPWPLDQDASHHMGTTRMGADPRESVVNNHCRVHGVKNVYISGASVFPTSGCANPTFTIVALAIRLADHIKSNVLKSNISKTNAAGAGDASL